MNEREARDERRDYLLQSRVYERRGSPQSYQDEHLGRSYPEPARLATSPYDIGRGMLRWTAIAFGCWGVISGGMYLGYVVLRVIIFGPDVF